MLGEFCFTRAVEVVQCGAAAGHRHQQRLARSAHLRTAAVAPIQVAGDKAYTACPPGTANGRGEAREIQRVRSRAGSMVRGRPIDRRMSCWWIMASVSAILPPKPPVSPCGWAYDRMSTVICWGDRSE